MLPTAAVCFPVHHASVKIPYCQQAIKFCSQPYVPTPRLHHLTDALTRAAGIVRLSTALMLDATVAVSRLAPRFERAPLPVGGSRSLVLRLDRSSPRLARASGLVAPERALLESVTKLAVVDLASRADVRGVIEALLAVVAAPIIPVVDGGSLRSGGRSGTWATGSPRGSGP